MRVDEGVEDAIGDGEVVDGRAVGLFGIEIGRAPLQGALAVAGRQQIVWAKIDGRGTHRGQLPEQLLPVGSVEVIGLIGAKIARDRGIWSNWLPEVYADMNQRRGRGGLCGCGGEGGACKEADRQKPARDGSPHRNNDTGVTQLLRRYIGKPLSLRADGKEPTGPENRTTSAEKRGEEPCCEESL